VSGRLRTVDDLRLRELTAWRPTGRHPNTVLAPIEAGVFLATSRLADCLTHIVRNVTIVHPWHDHRVGRTHLGHTTYVAWCAQFAHRPVDPDDELFGCHLCIARADRYGYPTFNLVPATGCEVSGGKRGRRRLLAAGEATP